MTTMKNAVFCDVTLHSPTASYWWIGAICCRHHQGRRI